MNVIIKLIEWIFVRSHRNPAALCFLFWGRVSVTALQAFCIYQELPPSEGHVFWKTLALNRLRLTGCIHRKFKLF